MTDLPNSGPDQTSSDAGMDSGVAALRHVRSGLRVMLVIALCAGSLIPLWIVDGIADERRGYFDEAHRSLANSWGRPQEVAGPLLVVPVDYEEQLQVTESGWQREKSRTTITRKHVVLLPSELTVSVLVDHQIRQRSIYDIALFSADVDATGHFVAPRRRILEHIASLGGTPGVVDWSGAVLVVGVSDTRAIRLTPDGAQAPVVWNASSATLQAGRLEGILGSSVQAPVRVPESDQEGEEKAGFALRLQLGATGSLAVSALGGVTRYTFESDWPHPSFTGAHSPVRRTVTEHGSSAAWAVHGLARGLPDVWVHEDAPRNLFAAQMRVGFYNPVTPYTVIDRGIKYGLLFVALTFLTFLCFELHSGRQLHVVQYGVISLGLIMFYLTLLACSEHLPFTFSYGLATALIAGLLGAYTWAMTGQRLFTALVTMVLLCLYCTLFVLLQLEDYALLMGTVLLLIGLGALMYVTRGLSGSGTRMPVGLAS